jgi:hypothetical protein
MKARLEFDLPEEQEEFDLCHRASDLYSNLWDLAQQIRTWRKHGHRFKDAEELLDALWEDCIDHEVHYSEGQGKGWEFFIFPSARKLVVPCKRAQLNQEMSA